MKFENQTFKDDHVLLDGNRFHNVTFQKCNLEYRGYASVDLIGCTFDACRWSFGEPAANAIKFLSAIYAQGGDAKTLVEKTFDAIRAGHQPPITKH